MTTEDIPCLKLREKWMYERYYDYLQTSDSAWIIEDNGEILCAFGALFEWNSTSACEVWYNLIRKDKVFAMIKMLRKFIVNKAKELGIKRMQAVVECSSVTNEKFLKFMGFVNETPFGMKYKLYNGETAFLFARYF